MGGKSDSSPQPPPVTYPDNSQNEAIMTAFLGQLGAMQEQLLNAQTPELPAAPKIEREPIINWAEKNKELLAKSKADFGVDQARKKGRTATVLTSPFLDEEDAATTGSILAT